MPIHLPYQYVLMLDDEKQNRARRYYYFYPSYYLENSSIDASFSIAV